MIAKYGVHYRLCFSLVPVLGFEVANVTSRPIRAQPCAQIQFYIKGLTECNDCPMGAKCDGSDVLVTQVCGRGLLVQMAMEVATDGSNILLPKENCVEILHKMLLLTLTQSEGGRGSRVFREAAEGGLNRGAKAGHISAPRSNRGVAMAWEGCNWSFAQIF